MKKKVIISIFFILLVSFFLSCTEKSIYLYAVNNNIANIKKNMHSSSFNIKNMNYNKNSLIKYRNRGIGLFIAGTAVSALFTPGFIFSLIAFFRNSSGAAGICLAIAIGLALPSFTGLILFSIGLPLWIFYSKKTKKENKVSINFSLNKIELLIKL
ncbi:MAG: hypothetical protein KAT05_05550 [Spirochaetes bacterium]|nr:hypothetical protein [Spirochaetota bacterium]